MLHVKSVGHKWKDIWSLAIWLCLVSAVLPIGYYPYQTSTTQDSDSCVLHASGFQLTLFRPNFEQHYYPDSLEVSPELPLHAGLICKSQQCDSPMLSFCLSASLNVFNSSVQKGVRKTPPHTISDSCKSYSLVEGSLINQCLTAEHFSSDRQNGWIIVLHCQTPVFLKVHKRPTDVTLARKKYKRFSACTGIALQAQQPPSFMLFCGESHQPQLYPLQVEILNYSQQVFFCHLVCCLSL